MKKSSVIKALTAFGVLAAGTTMFAPAANAAYSCGAGQVCFFANSDQTGSVFVAGALKKNGDVVWNFGNERFTNGASANDAVSSIVNNTGSAVFVFTDSNKSGTLFVVKPYETVHGITAVTVYQRSAGGHITRIGSINDMISSATLEPYNWWPAGF
ncbi:peptidase inhibitor family I36 protein [Actinoplanes sp. TBRC 11911]|uniref:peptidase inhibitor family I36 protein n=1 Tax=Actinoplanes sp. TBRC 11911 TaxID=2729386 RepID=UPI00145C7943|nr:peptidase inhibitor family I36 protein [Actinoplanes sp. TBRC 11911]NMO57694.1 peptidase inhibitor family I36 protein [Actinoplanes sp. TBRC 11911]